MSQKIQVAHVTKKYPNKPTEYYMVWNWGRPMILIGRDQEQKQDESMDNLRQMRRSSAR